MMSSLRGGFSEARSWPQLVHCATDGESFGHHSRFGEMALAAALRTLGADRTLEVTNYGAFLAAHPPTHEAQIRQGTSWSCAHGVERWRSDCGCRFRPDSQQRWRGPLRTTLDWLRDQTDSFYEARAGAYLKDVWAARDDYGAIVLDRDPRRLEAFLASHQAVPLDADALLSTRRLLELQRNRMLMYTSCGWFFDEISGLEPVQILKYAAIVMQYLRDLGGPDLEPELERRLAAAPSNAADFAHGGEVYRRLVTPPPPTCGASPRTTPSPGSSPSIPTRPRSTATASSGWTRRVRPAAAPCCGWLTSGSSRRSPGRPATSCTRCFTSGATTSRARCAPGKAGPPTIG